MRGLQFESVIFTANSAFLEVSPHEDCLNSEFLTRVCFPLMEVFVIFVLSQEAF